MTKLEIIDEVLGMYAKNPKLRAVTYDEFGNPSCLYSTQDGRHCAVGMCMTKDSQERIGYLSTSVYDLELDYGLNNLLEEKYIGHDESFWQDLQNFHDNEDYFTETGLSNEGERKLAAMKITYGDN